MKKNILMYAALACVLTVGSSLYADWAQNLAQVSKKLRGYGLLVEGEDNRSQAVKKWRRVRNVLEKLESAGSAQEVASIIEKKNFYKRVNELLGVLGTIGTMAKSGGFAEILSVKDASSQMQGRLQKYINDLKDDLQAVATSVATATTTTAASSNLSFTREQILAANDLANYLFMNYQTPLDENPLWGMMDSFVMQPLNPYKSTVSKMIKALDGLEVMHERIDRSEDTVRSFHGDGELIRDVIARLKPEAIEKANHLRSLLQAGD